MIHNLWYTTLGALQWVGWEVLFLRGWALGYFDFMSDAEAFGSIGGWARMAAYSCFVPLWRDFHFYFAHRFLHIRCLYKFVHVLHHRNKEIEPWSGLCMHPIEHLYYFACVAPSMYLRMHPFHLWWHGVHLLLSPAASHSGWEDHFQSDQFHYLHHKRFECNYGSSGTALDKIFGTFRSSLDPKYKSYMGKADEKSFDKQTREVGAKQSGMEPTAAKKESAGDEQVYVPKKKGITSGGSVSIAGAMPKTRDFIYYVLCGVIAAFVVCAISGADTISAIDPRVVGGIAGFGPVIIAYAMTLMTKDSLSVLWPFHADSWKSLQFHIIIGTAVTAVPVAQLVAGVLGRPPPMLHL